ncbi:hypothetical protein OIU74_001378 [Salix koriyanagi]|uniref:Uncharacterized protein n=1 Tax=Salix koriyanagi TaxID=2511006 RepID=A0A9Q0X3W3_9ROSI|nr:hypothetical protein OIU74_001378 [Salix koriyanagi]
MLIPIKVKVQVSLTGATYITNGALPPGNSTIQVLVPSKMTGHVCLAGATYITDGSLPPGNSTIQVLVPSKLTSHALHREFQFSFALKQKQHCYLMPGSWSSAAHKLSGVVFLEDVS